MERSNKYLDVVCLVSQLRACKLSVSKQMNAGSVLGRQNGAKWINMGQHEPNGHQKGAKRFKLFSKDEKVRQRSIFRKGCFWDVNWNSKD